MKYYGIYKITNLSNGMMYIGKHITSNLDDGYMGSSPWLNRSIKKHGKQNYRKEWLMFCEDEDEMNYMERVFVDQTWVDRSDTYNLNIGGKGGWSYVNSLPLSEETRKKLSISTTRRNTGHKLSEETKKKIGLANSNPSEETRRKISESKKGHKMSEAFRKRQSEIHKGISFSDEHKNNLSKSLKGKNTWTKGTHWFNNGVVNIKATTCPDGFVYGKLIHKKTKLYT